MADDPIERLRLSLMQDVLPVGLAMFKRVRTGGASKVVEVFQDSKDPFQELRMEGEVAAQSVREHLDQFSPGLGNPVVNVKVAVNEEFSRDIDVKDQEVLKEVLGRIQRRLEGLENVLQDHTLDDYS